MLSLEFLKEIVVEAPPLLVIDFVRVLTASDTDRKSRSPRNRQTEVVLSLHPTYRRKETFCTRMRDKRVFLLELFYLFFYFIHMNFLFHPYETVTSRRSWNGVAARCVLRVERRTRMRRLGRPIT